MDNAESLDVLFREAVSAIDAGDVAGLERQLTAHPNLARDRLDSPGAWLRDKVGDALDGFFARPYLLWFVAEDPVRNGKLPSNIAQVAQTIIDAAKRQNADTLQEQLDYALRLVCWSWIARECGVSIALVDVLVDAGASVDGRNVYGGRYGTHSDSAIYNGNFAAAERLLERGAARDVNDGTLFGSMGRRRASGIDRDTGREAGRIRSSGDERQSRGTSSNAGSRRQSDDGQRHEPIARNGPAPCRVLRDARRSAGAGRSRADLNRRDTIYDATPLGWAKYCGQQETDASIAKQYAEIAAYLSEQGAKD